VFANWNQGGFSMSVSGRCLLFLLLLGLSAGCGGGGSSAPGTPPAQEQLGDLLLELEPNDSPATAGALQATSGLGGGSLSSATDVDWWKIDLTAGQRVSIEVFAARLFTPAAGWGPNGARLTLFDPTGATELVDQSNGGDPGHEGFDASFHYDMDIACFTAPAAGSYRLRVSADNAAPVDAPYVLRVGPPGLFGGGPGTMGTESEPAGSTGQNDTMATAQALGGEPAQALRGHGDGAGHSDYFSFTTSAAALVSLGLKARRMGRRAGAALYDQGVLTLHDAGGVIATGQPVEHGDPWLERAVLTPGTYYVEVSGVALGAAYELSGLSPLPIDVAAEFEPGNDTRAGAQGLGQAQRGAIGSAAEEDWYQIVASGPQSVFLRLLSGGQIEGGTAEVPWSAEDASGTPLSFVAIAATGEYRGLFPAAGTYYIKVGGPGAAAGAPYVVGLSGSFSGDAESEPNNPGDTPDVLTGISIGQIDGPADTDVFSFTAQANQFVLLDLEATPAGNDPITGWSGWAGSSLQGVLMVRDDQANVLALMAQDPSPNPYPVGISNLLPSLTVGFLAPADGTYTVQVAPMNVGQTGSYLLRLR